MFATDGSVSSQNVVGYQGMSITADLYYMITAQFDATTGNGTGLAVKDLVKGNIPVGAEMQVRLPEGGYDIYKYSDMAYDASYTGEDPSLMFVPGWADGLGNLVTSAILKSGCGAWIKPAQAVSVTWESPVQ